MHNIPPNQIPLRRALVVAFAAVILVTAGTMAADSRSKTDKPLAPQTSSHSPKPAAGIPPILVNVRLTSGDYIPMGAGITGAMNHGDTSSANSEKQTLSIELFNRTGTPINEVEIRYTLYKVVTIHETHPTRRNGVYEFRRTTRELPPQTLSNGSEVVSLKPGQRKNVAAHASLLAEDVNSRPLYNRRGMVIGYDIVRREDIYGYIVEVIHDGKMIAGRLSPSSIRNDMQEK